MHRQSGFVFSIALVAAAAPVAARDSMQSMPTVDAAALDRAQARFTQALAVVRRFDAIAQREGFNNEGWRRELLAHLMQADEAARANVAAAESLAEAMDRSRLALRIVPAEPANLLGSSTSDLVFIPITPCRILDTRAGGSLKAGVTYSFSYDAGNTGAGSCGVHSQIPGLPSSYPAAEAVNVTLDENAFSGFSAGSYLAIFPEGGTLGSSFMNFGPGQVVANAGVIALNSSDGEFSLLSNANTNVIVDVYGVFMPPQATALDCNDGQQASTSLPANGHVGLSSSSCQAGYTLTGGMCSGGDATSTYLKESRMDVPTFGSGWHCEWISKNASAQTVYANPRCCRVPGR